MELIPRQDIIREANRMISSSRSRASKKNFFYQCLCIGLQQTLLVHLLDISTLQQKILLVPEEELEDTFAFQTKSEKNFRRYLIRPPLITFADCASRPLNFMMICLNEIEKLCCYCPLLDASIRRHRLPKLRHFRLNWMLIGYLYTTAIDDRKHFIIIMIAYNNYYLLLFSSILFHLQNNCFSVQLCFVISFVFDESQWKSLTIIYLLKISPKSFISQIPSLLRMSRQRNCATSYSIDESTSDTHFLSWIQEAWLEGIPLL